MSLWINRINPNNLLETLTDCVSVRKYLALRCPTPSRCRTSGEQRVDNGKVSIGLIVLI